jgi:hypothetical protein
MDKIKMTKEQFKIFESGHMIQTRKGTFFNFPYWIKKNGEEDVYELYSRSEIPDIESSFKNGGIKNKYEIRKIDGTQVDPEAWYFVLRVDKDPHAQVAAMAYAHSVADDNRQLSEELLVKVREFNPSFDVKEEISDKEESKEA